jgi:glycosyltransferase involved in cell wall biosynthesis
MLIVDQLATLQFSRSGIHREVQRFLLEFPHSKLCRKKLAFSNCVADNLRRASLFAGETRKTIDAPRQFQSRFKCVHGCDPRRTASRRTRDAGQRLDKVHNSVQFQQHIEVVFDGIDCRIVKPDEHATFAVAQGGRKFSARDEVITFVNRNLEPMRGFHVFMRALPELQKRRPDAPVVIAGGDGRSYSPSPSGGTWREKYCREIGEQVDWSKVHFVGRLTYERYLRLLQVSTAHVYLTYPFVLSWSMLEAMAAGCVVIGSRTAPVEEVIRHGENGLLADFFEREALIDALEMACASRNELVPMRLAARETVTTQYDFRTTCLPHQIELLTSGFIPPIPGIPLKQ